MHLIDYIIAGLYLLVVLGVGYYHFRKNKDNEDYFVGSRQMKAGHVGLSIVATDVGGGFSIGLGGLGYVMGISGSWLLFTGLIGAWLTAVLLIPRIKKIDQAARMYTYPDFLATRFNKNVAGLAALISGIGYLGFTGAQILAGAKLASATLIPTAPLGMSPVTFAILIIAVITILYTVLGGLKAVIYTDTIQWIILLGGLIFLAIPLSIIKLGGFSAIKVALPPEYFSFRNIKPVTFANWMITIIPIWFIGMTLYQRMYACKNEKEAKKAWYLAGIMEYPIMAFTGVFLGMCSKILFPEVEPEMGLPLLIRQILPMGVAGIVIASYFSAIMSTADSCLMAASGNFVNDIIEKFIIKKPGSKHNTIRISQIMTLMVGVTAITIALKFKSVLDAILYAYSFMVGGLFIPTLGAYFWKRSSSAGALGGMIAGGTLTILLQTKVIKLPEAIASIGLDATLYGLIASLIFFISLSLIIPDKKTANA